MQNSDQESASLFESLNLSESEQQLLIPFFTNTDKPVFAVTELPPEVIGALCSRASRAKGDLRTIFLEEFIKPFLEKQDEYGKALQEFINFLHQYPINLIFSNPKGREFYIKWLAQYGDDSIAQMAGLHLIYSSLSLVSIKHFEHMRMGLAPIEKSTRYVDYSTKVNGNYRYYTDPQLKGYGLFEKYQSVMNHLFDTYTELLSKYIEFLKQKYPTETESLLKTKAFDTLRGLLPLATLSQVAFFGNGQAFEYAFNRSLKNPLTEIRWAANQGLKELNQVAPAFFHRIQSEPTLEYQAYLCERSQRLQPLVAELKLNSKPAQKGVRLISFDPDGENKVIAALLYSESHMSFEELLYQVKGMTEIQKRQLLDAVLQDRKARWYKIPRAFEYAQLSFEITANWSVWKDLQRHRMHTQLNEAFNSLHGYDIPNEIIEAGLATQYQEAIDQVTNLYQDLCNINPSLAQYAVTQTHLLRFTQHQNLRAFFWEAELRTIAQGHPDYRKIEQEKIKLVQKVYPLLSQYLIVDMNDYDFARRGSEKGIASKEESLKDYLQDK